MFRRFFRNRTLDTRSLARPMAGRLPAFALALFVFWLTASGCLPLPPDPDPAAPQQSRLEVCNCTKCTIRVRAQLEDPNASTGLVRRFQILAPGETVTWNLPPGVYVLSACNNDVPTERFIERYQAQCGERMVWPILPP